MKEKLFTKSERSTFPYWFAHWCAYNMTALVRREWKFRYLFHDFEKPWIRLFCKYETVQKFHRTHSRHHIEWIAAGKNVDKRIDKFRFRDMILDWLSNPYTKEAGVSLREEVERVHEKAKQLLESNHRARFVFNLAVELEKMKLNPIYLPGQEKNEHKDYIDKLSILLEQVDKYEDDVISYFSTKGMRLIKCK